MANNPNSQCWAFSRISCFIYVSFACVAALPAFLAAQERAQAFSYDTIDPSDEMAVRSLIRGWLRTWENPPDVESEWVALNALFGHPVLGQGYQVPDDIKAKLMKRGLKYKNWESRRAAVNGFMWFLYEDDPEPLLMIFAEGLKDPHRKVREEAVFAFVSAVSLIEHGPLTTTWKPETIEKVEKHREALIDEIVLQVIAKGLTDKDGEVLHLSFLLLRSLESAPTPAHLRALEEVIASKAIKFRVYAEHAEELRTVWQRKIHGEPPVEPRRSPNADNEVEELDDPFGVGE